MGTETCATIRERLSAYLDNELSEAQREDVRAHLESCVACQAELEALQGMSGLLAAWDVPAVDPQISTVFAARLAEHSAPRGWRLQWPRVAWIGGTAVMLACALLYGRLAGRHESLPVATRPDIVVRHDVVKKPPQVAPPVRLAAAAGKKVHRSRPHHAGGNMVVAFRDVPLAYAYDLPSVPPDGWYRSTSTEDDRTVVGKYGAFDKTSIALETTDPTPASEPTALTASFMSEVAPVNDTVNGTAVPVANTTFRFQDENDIAPGYLDYCKDTDGSLTHLAVDIQVEDSSPDDIAATLMAETY